jgi:hypothetical protein
MAEGGGEMLRKSAKVCVAVCIFVFLLMAGAAVYATSATVDSVYGNTYATSGGYAAYSSSNTMRASMSVIIRGWAEGKIKDDDFANCVGGGGQQCSYVGNPYIGPLNGAYYVSQHAHTNFGSGSFAFYTASGNNAANSGCYFSFSTGCFG